MQKYLLLFTFLIFTNHCLDAQVIYVSKNSTGSNNGTSWANAYSDLNIAITAATAGTEIWVKAGTYYPDNGSDRDKSFNLKNGVTILGGFSGTETNQSQRNFKINTTILSGEIGNLSLKTDNSYHVLFSSNNDATSIIDGFTITAGAAGQGTYLFGGGIYILDGSPVIKNCIFANNMSTQWAGALFSMNSSSVVEGCTFQENSANDNGGSLCLYQGTITIRNSSFINNSCPTDDCQGGAIYNYNGVLKIENSSFKIIPLQVSAAQ